MLRCPHCRRKIELRTLPHQGWMRTDRICPGCGGCFEVDPATKRRQALVLVLVLISLALTLLAYHVESKWWIAAFVSYLPWVWLIWWANRLVRLVPCEGGEASGETSGGP